MRLRPAPPAANWILKQLGSKPEHESMIGDLMEQYQQGRGRIWLWRQIIAIAFLKIYRRGRVPVSTRVSTGQGVILMLLIVVFVAALLSDIWQLGLLAVLSGVSLGILKFVLGNGRAQQPQSNPISVARIDSSKIPIRGGLGAGLLILILLTGVLVDLPRLRLLAAPGILAGLVFGAILHLWRKRHAPEDRLQSLGLAEHIESTAPTLARER